MTTEEMKKKLVSTVNEPLIEVSSGYLRSAWRPLPNNMRSCTVYTFTTHAIATPATVFPGLTDEGALQEAIERIEHGTEEEQETGTDYIG